MFCRAKHDQCQGQLQQCHEEGGRLLTRQAFIPSMLTTSIPIVRQDCLCYLMEPYQIAWGEKTVHDTGHAWRAGN